MSTIKLLIYDLDGTLIDSRQDIASAVNWTLSELSLKSLPAEEISAFVGAGVTHLIGQVLKTVGAGPRARPGSGQPQGVAPAILKRSIKIFRKRYGEHLLDQTRAYPSVRKVLEFFKARKQAVITNKPEGFSKTILRGLGIDSYFFRVVGGDQGFPKKPDPKAVLDILKTADASPAEALLIGDSAIDVETGRKAGVKTAAVTYGFGKREEIDKSQPDFLWDDLEELLRCPLLKN